MIKNEFDDKLNYMAARKNEIHQNLSLIKREIPTNDSAFEQFNSHHNQE